MKRYEVTVTRLVTERWLITATSKEHAEHNAVNRKGKLDANFEEVHHLRVHELEGDCNANI